MRGCKGASVPSCGCLFVLLVSHPKTRPPTHILCITRNLALPITTRNNKAQTWKKVDPQLLKS